MRHQLNLVAVGALLAVTCALHPGNAVAQNRSNAKSDLLLRIDGPASVRASDTIGTLIVIGSDATVNGSVKDLIVINGTAHVAGRVHNELALHLARVGCGCSGSA